MCADSTFERYLTGGRNRDLNFVGIGLITLAIVLTYVVPAAAQTSTSDTQASQEEEALDDLLTDEEEIKFKRKAPPAGAVGSKKWDDPENSKEAPPAPVDPEQIITSPGNVDPARDPLSKEEKHAAQIYVDDEIEKRLARVAGRVPDDEIDHHVVYTPSPAAQKNPNREALERQLWKQRLAEYKQAKLADRLLKDLEGAGAEPAGGTAPDGAAPTGGESGNSQIGSFLERLLGAGGAGGDDQPSASQQSGPGAGPETGADGQSGTAEQNDRPGKDQGVLGQGEGRARNGTDEQPLGTVTLGDPPSADRSQPTTFDKFVADSGLLGRQNAASVAAPNGAGGATGQGSGTQPSAADTGTAASSGGQQAGVPKPKPRPPQLETASVAGTSGSTGGEPHASDSAGAAASTPDPSATAGATASPPATENAQARQKSISGSSPASSSGKQGDSASPTPLIDLLAAANAALDRADRSQTPPSRPNQSPESAGQSAAPVEETRPPPTVSPGEGKNKEKVSGPVAAADPAGSSGESFADRFSFSREIAALSSTSADVPPAGEEAAVLEGTDAEANQSRIAPSGSPLGEPRAGTAATQVGGETEQERSRRRQFERVAMEKFIAKEALAPAEKTFVAEAREASLAKSKDQVNDQLRNAVELQNTATSVREDVAAIAEESAVHNKLSYLQPATNAAYTGSRAVQAGGQAIMVATNSAAGRTTTQLPAPAPDNAGTTSETNDPSAGPENRRKSEAPLGAATVKLFRPDDQKNARPEKDAADTAIPPPDQTAKKTDRDLQRERQVNQSEQLARKLEREARQETTRARFDNCILFIFCSATKIELPKISPDEPKLGASAGADDGVQLVRP